MYVFHFIFIITICLSPLYSETVPLGQILFLPLLPGLSPLSIVLASFFLFLYLQHLSLICPSGANKSLCAENLVTRFPIDRNVGGKQAQIFGYHVFTYLFVCGFNQERNVFIYSHQIKFRFVH